MTFLLLFIISIPAFADRSVDACLDAWGNSPFEKGSNPNQIVGTSVKVFGIGKESFKDSPTEKSRLVLLKPSVNVLGVTKIQLLNPNGWYCFKSNVSVLGKIEIEAHCNAKIASSSTSGTKVLGADESKQGVVVMGALRINRLACNDQTADAADEKTEK